MDHGFFSYIAYAVGVVSLVSLAGTAIYSKQRTYLTELVKQENDALKESNERLQNDNKTFKTAAEKAEGENRFLRESASGRADFTVLSEQMAKQHTEVIKQLGSVATELSKLAKAIVKERKDG